LEIVLVLIKSGNIDTDARNRIVVEIDNCRYQGLIVDSEVKNGIVTCRRKSAVSAVENLQHVERNFFCDIFVRKCDGFEAAAPRGKGYEELTIGVGDCRCN
jgi:hypothetical protein